ncbi:MAG: autotransporter-associated beta strand repeat-containing protein [Thermoguttaceae bacterium]|nr:autotransporter-associated beta strand repeat-containing protein [Thermoguttaceae bacterium]
MTQLLSKRYENLLTALFLLAVVFACMNAKAETVWSTGGTYGDTTSITNGLTINSPDAVDITGKYTVSGVVDPGNDAAAIRLYGAGTVTVKSGGELSINAAGTKAGLVAYPGIRLNVESGATMNITTLTERVRFSRGSTKLNDKNTIVNWAGTGTWDLGGGNSFFFSLTTPDDNNSATFNITDGSLNIKNGKISMAFGSTTNWNITGGTLTVGEGDLALNFGGGEYNASATTVGNITVNGGTFNVRGSGNWQWGQRSGTNPSNLTLDLNIQSGTFSTSRSITQDTGITTYNENITLAGGTFEAVKPGTADVTLNVEAGIATKLTASSAFNVDEGVTLNYNSPITRTAGDLTKTGSGTLNLTAENTLTDASIQISGGTLAVTDPNQLGGASKITIGQNGTLGIKSSEGGEYPQTIESTGTLKITSAAANDFTTLTGTVTGTINKTGNGTLLVTDNNLTGVTKFTMTEGKIQFGNGGASSTCAYTSDARSFDLKSGGTLTFNYAIANDLNIYGALTSENGTIEVTGSGGGHLALRGAVSGSFIKTGSGNLAMGSDNGANLTKITIKQGVLRNYSASRLGNGATEIELNGGIFSAPETQSLSNPFTVTANSSISVHPNKTLTLTGSLTAASGKNIEKTGDGTLVLSNSSTSLEGTILNINSGKLKITENMSLKAIGANTTGATLEIAAGKTVDLNEGINNYQTGKMHKTGEGTLIIAHGEGTGALPLEFYLDEGTLVLNRGATMTDAKTLYMADGTTFRFQGSKPTYSPIKVTGTATLDIPNDKTMDHSGTFTGGTLNKTSAGTLKLTGSATNTTNFNVQAGTLELATTGGAAAANDLTINDGATLNISGQNQNVTNLVTMNSGSVMNLNVTGADVFSSLTAGGLDLNDGAKIQISFNDSIDPASLGTLELLTADEFKVNGNLITSDDAMRALLENYVDFSSSWAQLNFTPYGETGYTVFVQGDYSSVPEPSTWLLALLGFVSLGVLKRRFPRH